MCNGGYSYYKCHTVIQKLRTLIKFLFSSDASALLTGEMNICCNKNCINVPCNVKVKFQNEIKIIELPWENFSFDSFKDACKLNLRFEQSSRLHIKNCYQQVYSFTLVIAEFNVKITDGSNTVLILTDNLGAPIAVNKFNNIVKTFHRGSMFYINVQYESAFANSTTAVVTPMVRL